MKDKLLNDFKNSLQLLELIQMAKVENDPYVQELYHWSLLTGLKHGEVAEKAKTMLANQLIPQALNNLLTNPEEILSELIEDKSQKVQSVLQEYREFMEEILAHPEESVVAHYISLGWSRGKGNRVKAELLAQLLVESETVKSGHGRPKEILKITPKAKELFGL